MINKSRTVVTIMLVFILGFLSASIAQGQDVEAKAKKSDFRGYFMFGGNILDIDALNTRLESKGYSEFSDEFFSFGGGFSYGIGDRAFVGGEGHILVGEEKEASIPSGDYKASLTGFYGTFDFGVLAYSKRGLNVYPFLGIGYGSIGLKIGPYVFEDIIENPTRSAELSANGFLLNVGVGTDYLAKIWRDEKKESGFVFGVRLGYTFAPFEYDWLMDDIDVSGGPDIGITGPYFRIMLGFGERSKD